MTNYNLDLLMKDQGKNIQGKNISEIVKKFYPKETPSEQEKRASVWCAQAYWKAGQNVLKEERSRTKQKVVFALVASAVCGALAPQVLPFGALVKGLAVVATVGATVAFAFREGTKLGRREEAVAGVIAEAEPWLSGQANTCSPYPQARGDQATYCRALLQLSRMVSAHNLG